MSIRARSPGSGRPNRSSAAAASAIALALAGCGAAPEPEPSAQESFSGASTDEDCLALVWREQERPDRQFDRTHDLAEGGAISCATGTSASQMAAALASLRAAAEDSDKARLFGELRIPLLYIDADGTRRRLSERELAGARFDEVFSPEVIALLRRVRLEDLIVVPGEGAFVELGAVWLVPDRPGGRPRVVTVNRQALGEAAAAARRSRQSPPAPTSE